MATPSTEGLESQLRSVRSHTDRLRARSSDQQAELDRDVAGGLSRVVVRSAEKVGVLRYPSQTPEMLDELRLPDTLTAPVTPLVSAAEQQLVDSLRGGLADLALLERQTARQAARLERLRSSALVGAARHLDLIVDTLRSRRPSTNTPLPSAKLAPSPATPRSAATLAITVSVRSLWAGRDFGDLHLARDLAAALRRRGLAVHVQGAAECASNPRTVDIALAMRGQHPVAPTPGAIQVLWIISHPESVSTQECDDADLVLVASQRFAADLRSRTSTRVEVFLQATEHRRFYPRRPVERFAHPIAIVANARNVLRPVVADAVAAGLEPAIYGYGWDRLVDPELVRALFVPNDELPSLYSSIGVLACDHWSTMRAWGFVSNRLFDALACATPVVCDHIREIDELFDGSVACYEGPVDLAELTAEALGDPAAARDRAKRGRALVLSHHTFDERAATLMGLLELTTERKRRR